MYDEYNIETSFQLNRESITTLYASDPRFKHAVVLRRLRPDTTLTSPAKPLVHPVIILDGSVNIESFHPSQENQKEERRKLFALPFAAGTVLDPLLFADFHTYSVKAAEPTVVCHLLTDLASFGETWPEVLEALLQSQIAVQQQLYDEQLEAYESVRTRLVRLLLRESEAGNAPITMSHRAIAERLGTYRETVSNQLARLKNNGLIDYGYRVIRVLDVDRLGNLTFTYDSQF